MSASHTIAKVLETDLLTEELLIVPARGATRGELQDEQILIGRRLTEVHQNLLTHWNGIDLEVIRFFGCGIGVHGIRRLSNCQVDFDFGIEGMLVIGSDPSGFMYIEGDDGRIYSADNDGGKFKTLASDLDDLVDRYIFGEHAADFAGDDWLDEVRASGLSI